MHISSTRVGPAWQRVPRCAVPVLAERLANWLALIALLALGIVWQ